MQKVQSMSLFFLYAFLVFITPVIVLPLTREAYEFPKLTVVYLLFCMIAAVFILSPRIIPRSKVIYLSLIYLFANVVSLVINLFYSDLNLYTAVWGYYGRYNGGLVSLFVYILLGMFAFSFFKKSDFEGLFNLSLLSTIPICLYAFVQKLGFVHIDGIRLYSTLGQPNWLASYLVFFMMIMFSFFFCAIQSDPLYLLDKISSSKIDFTEEKHVARILEKLVGDFMHPFYEDQSKVQAETRTDNEQNINQTKISVECIYRDIFLWCIIRNTGRL